MPGHCNRIAAKWQEKYPELQDSDALSGALSAAPIMFQGGRQVNAFGSCAGAARAWLRGKPFFGAASGFVVS